MTLAWCPPAWAQHNDDPTGQGGLGGATQTDAAPADWIPDDGTGGTAEDPGDPDGNPTDVPCRFNLPPVALIAPLGGDVLVGVPVTFNGSASFDLGVGGQVTSFQWSVDGQNFVPGDETYPYTFGTAGPHSVRLVVQDNCDVPSAPATLAVNVNVNQPPTAEVSPTSAQVEVGDALTFTGSASDPGGAIASYAWLVDGEEMVNGVGSQIPSFTFNEFNEEGHQYVVRLRVTDNLGALATADSLVTAVDPGPEPLQAIFKVEKLVSADPALPPEQWEWEEVGSANNPIEYGSKVKLNGTYSTGAVWYDWRKNGTLFCADPWTEKTYTGPVQFQLSLTVWSADWSQTNAVQKTVYVSGPTMQFLDVGPIADLNATDLAIDGNLAWTSHVSNVLTCFDVSDPSQLQLLSTTVAPVAKHLATASGYVYLCAGSQGLNVYSASVPPVLRRTFNTYAQDGQRAQDAVAIGAVVFLAAGPPGFKVLHMRNPVVEDPILLAALPLPSGAKAELVEVVGTLAYVADDKGKVHLIDISGLNLANPAPFQPTRLGQVGDSYVVRMFGVSEYGVLGTLTDAGLRFYDVDDLSQAPGTFDIYAVMGRLPSGMTILANRVYAGFGPQSAGAMEVARLDVANPASPYLMERASGSGFASGGPVAPCWRDGHLYWGNSLHDVMTMHVPSP